MRIPARAVACIVMILGAWHLAAQQRNPVKFSYTEERSGDSEVLVSIKAMIPAGVKLYGIQKNGDQTLYSTIVFDSTVNHLLSGALIEKGNAVTTTDSNLHQKVTYFTDSAKWIQRLRAGISDSLLLKGTISYMYSKGAEYTPAEEKIRLFIEPEKNTAVTHPATKETHSLLWILFTAFAGGLLALLTPCVYSMIPVTVGFFTKRSKTKAAGVRNAVYYALSIVIIFTLIGFLITLVFGPAALNRLATNWIANLVFFVLFVAFGLSFLGAFEITLPATWTNKSDSKAGTGNFTGIFFMALTLVLVSFSCTGPIIGNLLVLAAKGNYYGPLTGMLGFSVAMAFPFALFAFFPSRLNILGKAGGWLNSIKVVLGFLELALALKFLSNADLAKSWRLLDRDVFIAIWIVIFTFLGIYLLGKLRFHHDDALPANDFGVTYLSTKRLVFALCAFSFSIYLIPGLFGAPLKVVSAFLPPMGTQDFVMTANETNEQFNTATASLKPAKYYNQMKIYEPAVATSQGLTIYFDYNEALAAARMLKKPLMLDFTGINCVNCRKMESQVWSDPAVMEKLKNDFVIASLYVDAQHVDLQQKEIYFSTALNKKVETLGDKNTDMQVTKFGANSQPNYFFVDANRNKLLPQGYGYDPAVKSFLSMLEKVKLNNSSAKN